MGPTAGSTLGWGVRASRVAVALAVDDCLLCSACSTQIAGQPRPDPFALSENNEDPSAAIDGVVLVKYRTAKHTERPRRVVSLYDRRPPVGGAHDATRAPCDGAIYPQAVRYEHTAHTVGHVAVWIATTRTGSAGHRWSR